MSAYDKAVIAGSGTPISEYTGEGKQAIALANINALTNNKKMTGAEFVQAFNKHIPKEADYNLAAYNGFVLLILPDGSQTIIYDENGLTADGKKSIETLTTEIRSYIGDNRGDTRLRPIVTVPEPSSILIMGLAILLLAFSMMRTNRKHNA
jgi:rhamnose utilization protein RhaD (predicted bifunctional aldolase and dehydrogenase)